MTYSPQVGAQWDEWRAQLCELTAAAYPDGAARKHAEAALHRRHAEMRLEVDAARQVYLDACKVLVDAWPPTAALRAAGVTDNAIRHAYIEANGEPPEGAAWFDTVERIYQERCHWRHIGVATGTRRGGTIDYFTEPFNETEGAL